MLAKKIKIILFLLIFALVGSFVLSKKAHAQSCGGGVALTNVNAITLCLMPEIKSLEGSKNDNYTASVKIIWAKPPVGDIAYVRNTDSDGDYQFKNYEIVRERAGGGDKTTVATITEFNSMSFTDSNVPIGEGAVTYDYTVIATYSKGAWLWQAEKFSLSTKSISFAANGTPLTNSQNMTDCAPILDEPVLEKQGNSVKVKLTWHKPKRGIPDGIDYFTDKINYKVFRYRTDSETFTNITLPRQNISSIASDMEFTDTITMDQPNANIKWTYFVQACWLNAGSCYSIRRNVEIKSDQNNNISATNTGSQSALDQSQVQQPITGGKAYANQCEANCKNQPGMVVILKDIICPMACWINTIMLQLACWVNGLITQVPM